MFAEQTARACPCSPLRVPPRPPGPQQPCGPLAWAPPRRFREGEIDRARPSAAETHTLTHNPRHHNLNPSPTLRELQVTDHVGLTPARAGAPAPLPPPARVLQDRAPSSAKPPRRGELSRGGGRGEEEKLTLRLPRPLPPAPPASPPPATPPHAFSPAPSPLHSRSPAAPGGIFLVASFSFTFSFSSISEHSERRACGGTRGEPEREWGKS